MSYEFNNGSPNGWTSLVASWLEGGSLASEIARHWASEGPMVLASHIGFLVGACDEDSLRCDLLDHALKQVDWQEVAKQYMEAAPAGAPA